MQYDFIIKLTFIFLLIQPILDIKVFYDYEILGVTIPTIIRLIFFAVLFLLFIFNKKRLKLPIIYFVLFFIYSILHLINANNNYVNVLGKYSISSEVIYLIRLAIPMMFILFSYNYKVEFNKISKLFLKDNLFGPFISSLIGLIPNCASSVMLTKLYLEGVISFYSCLAGLLTSSGVALLLLFKVNENKKENLKILLTVYLIGALSGFIMELVCSLF